MVAAAAFTPTTATSRFPGFVGRYHVADTVALPLVQVPAPSFPVTR